MKVCKLFIAVLTAACVVVLSGCTNEVERVEGFQSYEDQAYLFRIQYPEEWIMVNSSLSHEELTESLSGYGDNADAMLAQLLTLDLTGVYLWYDFNHMNSNFVPNVNIGISRQPGLTNDELLTPDNIDVIQGQVDAAGAAYENFSLIHSVDKAEFGGNSFLTAQFAYTAAGNDISAYRAYIVSRGYLFTITLTTTKERFDASDKALFEKILPTLEFIKRS